MLYSLPAAHPIDALLVLVRLLVGDSDQLRHLLLRQAKHGPALTHPSPDVAVDILWPGSTWPSLGRHGFPHRYATIEERILYRRHR